MKRHIPLSELHLGQKVLLVPRLPDVAHGPGRAALAEEGEEVRLSEYHFNAIQRGACHALVDMTPEEEAAALLARAPAPAPAPAAASTEEAPAPAPAAAAAPAEEVNR